MDKLPKLQDDPLLEFGVLKEDATLSTQPADLLGVANVSAFLSSDFVRLDSSFGEGPEKLTSGSDQQTVYITFAGKHLIDPVQLRRQFENHQAPYGSFWGKANGWRMQSGRHSGVGKVLMNKQDFDSIKDKQLCQHEFVAYDGGNIMRQTCLCVVGAEAIIGRTDSIGGLSADSVVLITIGDSRTYARHSPPSSIFNWLQADSRFDQSTFQSVASDRKRWTYLTMLKAIFHARLRKLFCNHTLNFYHDLPNDLQPPESMQLAGLTSWDAFWAILDSIGWSFTLDFDGKPWVFSPNNSFPDVNTLALASKSHLIDSRSHQIDPAVPEKVTVIAHARDYQWWRSAETNKPQTGTLTATDNYQRWPMYRRSVRVRDIGGIQPKRIVPNTEHVVWAPYHVLTDDSGAIIDQDGVDEALTRFAKQHTNKIGPGMRWRDAEFSGAWPMRAGLWYTAGAWYDHGDGLKTRMWATPHEIGPEFDESIPSWEQKYAQTGLPVTTRETKPHARDLYGTVIDGIGSSGDRTGSVIEADGWCVVAAMSGHVAAPRVKWIQREPVRAINATGQAIPIGSRVFGRWNYQLGVGGEWVIVATGSSAVSMICAACMPLTHVTECESLSGAITLRKNSMLRLLKAQAAGDVREDSPPPSPAIDFSQGPKGTVLWTGDPDVFSDTSRDTIYWTRDPSMNTITTKKGFRIKDGSGELWLMASGGKQKFKFPSKPNRSHQYLIAGSVGGDCVTGAWFGPGLDCTVHVPYEITVDIYNDTFADCECWCSCGESCYEEGDEGYVGEGVEGNCYCDCSCSCHVDVTVDSVATVDVEYHTLQFSNGLLVGSTTGCKPPSESKGGSCDEPKFNHWNPCLDAPVVDEDDPYDDDPPPSNNPDITS